ncbi:MAG: DinB family protein [Chloroflexota bacterium]
MSKNIDPKPLTLDQIATTIEATPAVLSALIKSLPPEVTQWKATTNEWCINEVIGHIIEADRHGFDGRIRTIASQNQVRLQGWAINKTAESRRDCEKPVAILLDELTQMRKASADMIRELRTDALDNIGHHPAVGELKVVDILHEWVYHDQNHVKQIQSNIQAYLWPNLGTTQKFSSL